MIVDCHTHINSVGYEVELSDHLAAAETVEACIVLAAPGEKTNEQSNKKVSDYVNNHRDKMVGFAIIDPTKDNISIKGLTAVIERAGLKGVVLYCSDCEFHPCHSRAMQFYESVQELGLPIFFHNGGPMRAEAVLDYAQPYLLDEVARTFPKLKMVIGTMGQPFVGQTLAMIAKHENVYADLTIKPDNVWQIYNIVLAAHEKDVMDKLLFGSGYPLGRSAECIESLLSFNKLLGSITFPIVPLGSIRSVIERNSLEILGIER
jgi:uncharacterized protein